MILSALQGIDKTTLTHKNYNHKEGRLRTRMNHNYKVCSNGLLRLIYQLEVNSYKGIDH
jgi:hypothetical protein